MGSLVEHPLHVRQAGRDGDTKVEEIGYKPKDTSYCQAIVVGYREKLSQHRKCWREGCSFMKSGRHRAP